MENQDSEYTDRYNNKLKEHHMSIAQRELVASFVNWFLKITLGIAAFFAVSIFNDIRADVKQLGVDSVEYNIKVTNDLHGIKERLIRVETKLE